MLNNLFEKRAISFQTIFGSGDFVEFALTGTTTSDTYSPGGSSDRIYHKPIDKYLCYIFGV